MGLFKRDDRSEGEAAIRESQARLSRAQARGPAIDALTERLRREGRQNHFGEAITASMRRRFST